MTAVALLHTDDNVGVHRNCDIVSRRRRITRDLVHANAHRVLTASDNSKVSQVAAFVPASARHDATDASECCRCGLLLLMLTL